MDNVDNFSEKVHKFVSFCNIMLTLKRVQVTGPGKAQKGEKGFFRISLAAAVKNLENISEKLKKLLYFWANLLYTGQAGYGQMIICARCSVEGESQNGISPAPYLAAG